MKSLFQKFDFLDWPSNCWWQRWVQTDLSNATSRLPARLWSVLILNNGKHFFGKVFVGMNWVWIELTNQNIASTMVKLCCGIFFPSLTYVTPLYTTCHLFHENHPIHPLDRDHDHLAVETLVCGVAPPQTLDQSCSCRDLPENDFLVLPFLICCFYSEGFRIYHLSSQLTCWNASAAVSVALSEQIRSRESPE